MLPKKNRLTKKKDFDSVFKQGKGLKFGFLYLKYKKNNLKASRFGFVVGKNFSKKAAQRNKIKRRLREIIKNKLSKIEPGTDIIIVAMPGAEDDFNQLGQIIDKLFKKASL